MNRHETNVNTIIIIWVLVKYTRNPNKSKTYLVKLYTFSIDIYQYV